MLEGKLWWADACLYLKLKTGSQSQYTPKNAQPTMQPWQNKMCQHPFFICQPNLNYFSTSFNLRIFITNKHNKNKLTCCLSSASCLFMVCNSSICLWYRSSLDHSHLESPWLLWSDWLISSWSLWICAFSCCRSSSNTRLRRSICFTKPSCVHTVALIMWL